MVDITQAIRDPTSVFNAPEDIVADKSLNRKEKIDILLSWKYDRLELEVAAEENMPGSGKEADLLDRILSALHELKAEIDIEHTPPTKQ